MPESLSEPSGPIQSIRRSVTLPTKLNPLSQRAPGPNSENLIFYHPSAKIVHFAPRALVPIPSSSSPSDFDYPVDTIETLPWRSATERTVATAPLRLEKGLTVFLKCGNVVHAILRNSQCWCVDGVSKFVLRIRPLTYYRIEIPNETEDDKASVEDLKAALPTVLRYEVTPCPFKRAFTVELPEEAMAPRRKRAWRPKERHGSLPFNPGSNQGSPAEPKSEWLDSASTVSTGEDTDGAATDDSVLTPQRTNSTTSETLAADEHSPSSSVVLDPPPRQAPIRRSVTETPQTFTSLVAKFDATPVPEETPTPEPASHTKLDGTSTDESKAETGRQIEDRSEPDTRHVSVDEIQQRSNPAEPKPECQAACRTSNAELGQSTEPVHIAVTNAEPVAEPVQCPASDTQSKPERLAMPQGPAQPIHEIKPEPENFAKDYSAQVSLDQVGPEAEAGSDNEPEPEPEHEHDHDASFASSPASFHSADLLSYSESSSHTTPVECQDTLQKELARDSDSIVAPSAARIHPFSVPQPPASESDPSSTKSISETKDMTMKPSNSASNMAREDIPRPSLAIPSATSTRSSSSVKATSPSTDFDHMSTEFRRRAQATRQRDTSPMPPPSAIYQPAPAQDATSLLSKALTLVLVPPVSLFIVLLHIAARIVISPAVNTNPGATPRRTQSSSKDASVTEDDFSFPLEREASSEYEDAEITRKLDPWDLD